MIDNQLDLKAPADVFFYLRMSSDMQNKRSPQQQRETIERKIREMGCNFRIVGTFVDEGVSGRKTRRRPGLMNMLQALGHPKCTVTIVLIDDPSRLGRSDDIPGIKAKLKNLRGIRVLSALNHFSDPFQLAGMVLESMSDIIAKQENRTKAHQVLRGKIDTVNQHRWPGGPIPFGFRLETHFKEERGRQVIDFSVLKPNPETQLIVLIAFQEAAKTGYGETLLAAELNQDPRIPDKFKPITSTALRSWLRNPLYQGDYVWNKLATDMQGDRRIYAHNHSSKWTIVRDYCEAIVPRELWVEVERCRIARKEIHDQKKPSRHLDHQGANSSSTVGRGVALRYLLSGLVICSECKRAMQVTATGAYTLKNGESKRYERYYCPASRNGKCTNKGTFPEEWLRQEVIRRLLHWLFGTVK